MTFTFKYRPIGNVLLVGLHFIAKDSLIDILRADGIAPAEPSSYESQKPKGERKADEDEDEDEEDDDDANGGRDEDEVARDEERLKNLLVCRIPLVAKLHSDCVCCRPRLVKFRRNSPRQRPRRSLTRGSRLKAILQLYLERSLISHNPLKLHLLSYILVLNLSRVQPVYSVI